MIIVSDSVISLCFVTFCQNLELCIYKILCGFCLCKKSVLFIEIENCALCIESLQMQKDEFLYTFMVRNLMLILFLCDF